MFLKIIYSLTFTYLTLLFQYECLQYVDEFGNSTKHQQDILFKDERQKWRNPFWRCCKKSRVPAKCMGMCTENANRNKKHYVHNDDQRDIAIMINANIPQRELKDIGRCTKYRNSIKICRHSIKGKLFFNSLWLR